MTKIKDLPLLDRPIERLLNNGVTALSNEEIISILLKTGTKEKSVKELSQEILKEIKDIHDLKQLNIEKIIKIKGIGKTKAATLIAAIELGRRINKKIDTLNNVKITNSEQVFNYFK